MTGFAEIREADSFPAIAAIYAKIKHASGRRCHGNVRLYVDQHRVFRLTPRRSRLAKLALPLP